MSTNGLQIGGSSPQALLHVGSGGTPSHAGATDAYVENFLEVGGIAYLSSVTLGTPLTVANGGTGATSLTSGKILQGNGTGAITATLTTDTLTTSISGSDIVANLAIDSNNNVYSTNTSGVSGSVSSVVLGNSASASVHDCVVIGQGAQGSGTQKAVAIGYSTIAEGGVAIGNGCSSTASSVGIGAGSSAATQYSIALGYTQNTSTYNSIMIGSLGSGATATAAHQLWLFDSLIATLTPSGSSSASSINWNGDTFTNATIAYGSNTLTGVQPTISQGAGISFQSNTVGLMQAIVVGSISTGAWDNTNQQWNANATNTALQIDGRNLVLGDKVLVAFINGSNATSNGLFTMTTVQSSGVKWQLSRTPGLNVGSQFNGAVVFVQSGTNYKNTIWFCENFGTVTLGTTNISFVINNINGSFFGSSGSLISMPLMLNSGGNVEASATLGNLSSILDSSGVQAIDPFDGYLTDSDGSTTRLTWRGVSGATINGTCTATNFVGDGSTLSGIVFNDTAIDTQTNTTYTLALTDYQELVTLDNASAITLTVDTNANVDFPVGARIDLLQLGAGQVTVSPAGGVTINSYKSLTNLAGQYAAASLKQITTDNWVLVGNLA